MQIWGNAVGGHHRCVFCSADFSSAQILQYADCIGEQRKSLATLMVAHKDGSAESIGAFSIPGILLDDLETPLGERGLENYMPGHDRLHNCKGHVSLMFGLLKTEPDFDKVMALQKLLIYLHRHSFVEDMKGSDWRRWFACYRSTLLPCIRYQQQEAEDILRTWLEIQLYFCYQGEP